MESFAAEHSRSPDDVDCRNRRRILPSAVARNQGEAHEKHERQAQRSHRSAARCYLRLRSAPARAVLEQAGASKRRAVAASIAPVFEVDPLWPKPLPHHWLLGSTIGVWVDEQDHVWIIHRSSATLHNNEKALELGVGECCRGAPPVLVFDPAGQPRARVGRSGQKATSGPGSNHGIHVDHKGYVWIGGNGPKDAHVLKFTKDGKFLMQVGRLGKNAGSNDLDNFGRVAKIWVDPKTNEAYYRRRLPEQACRRARRRHGQDEALLGRVRQQARRRRAREAYDPKAPPPKQFRNPVHCVERANDGLRLRMRPPGEPSAGVQTRRHVREGGALCARDARLGLDLGPRVLQRSAAALHLPGGRHERESARDPARDDGGDHATSATADASPASSTACTASRPIRKATSTRPKRTKENACSASSTRASERCREARAWCGRARGSATVTTA